LSLSSPSAVYSSSFAEWMWILNYFQYR
jgi:hypothetical protein